jgi:hypothetical protein
LRHFGGREARAVRRLRHQRVNLGTHSWAVTSRGAPSCGSETGTHPLNSEPLNSKTRKEEGFTVSSSLRRPSDARRKVSSTGARGETARRRSDASFYGVAHTLDAGWAELGRPHAPAPSSPLQLRAPTWSSSRASMSKSCIACSATSVQLGTAPDGHGAYASQLGW